MKRIFFVITILCVTQLAFKPRSNDLSFVRDNYRFADSQLKQMLLDAEKNEKSFPRTTNKKGLMVGTSMYDWTPGFFPGNLWMVSEMMQDKALQSAALEWTNRLEPLQFYTQNHDLGFMMYCSYGNAYRLTGNPAYKEILLQSAKSLSTRFSPLTGCIKSWNAFRSWHGDKTYRFPVIIDNMMNLELLFFASKETGDTTYRHIAISHALQTMRNQIRDDYSSYHVVCYDSANGKVIGRETAQGYADNSTWSRGQAWGIYGFTMVYRETKDPRFLKTAEGMADWYIHHKNLPEDKVPYWDFNAGQPGYTPGVLSHAPSHPLNLRDASAAAITASALLELSKYAGNKSAAYRNVAIQILHSLASPAYRAKPGTNGNFLLMHSVGSLAHGSEVDVPLIYADYYFLEALKRYKDWYL